MTALSCMVSTIVEGLLGGLVHSVLVKRGRPDKVFSPLTAGAITFVAELVQMMIILLIARPFQDALHLVQSIAAPMMVTNTVGAALFMRILLDKRAMFEKYTSAFSATALKVAASTEGILRQGFNEENSMKVARVLIQSWTSARWRSPIATSCWRLPASATTTICRASLFPPRIRNGRLRPGRWSTPTATRCLTAARFIRTVSWGRRW